MEYGSREAEQTEHIVISRFIMRCQTNSETRRRVCACMKCMNVAVRFIFFLINILIWNMYERIIGARSYNCFLYIRSRGNATWNERFAAFVSHLMDFFFFVLFLPMVHLISWVPFSVAEPSRLTNTDNINICRTFVLFSANWSRTLISVGSSRFPRSPWIFQT